MSTKTKLKGNYKPTGNLAVDMVAACINHCERQKSKLNFIRLHPKYWLLFTDFVRGKIPGYDFSDGEVDFDGVKVTKGTSLMIKALYYELERPAPKVFLMN